MPCMLTEFDIVVQRSLLVMCMSFLNNGGLATHLFWLGTLKDSLNWTVYFTRSKDSLSVICLEMY